MGSLVVMVVIAIAVLIAFAVALLSKDGEAKVFAGGGGIVLGILGTLILVFSTITIVDDGHVGVQQTFGEYSDTTLDPGINIVAPWTNVKPVSVQTREFTFGGGSDDGGPITAQAQGGGNLTYDMTVQYNLAPASASGVLRDVGSNWEDVILYPAARSCGRDATGELSVEQAFTTGRGAIGTNNAVCLQGKVEPFGVVITDVLIREVDPGEQIRAAIDNKQAAEQEVQQARIDVRKAEEIARKEAVVAFGVSNAEQIIACGGTESTIAGVDGEDLTIIVPNDTCDDQFSTEYLQWLYINQLSEVDGVVILPPSFDGELFIQTPQPVG
jgi:regulator of protease activity HflC (stomatin/prohibitin superfamily)